MPTAQARSQGPDFRHVYVPIEDLDVLFGSKKGVLLTKGEFLELWKKAYPDGKPRAAAPDDLFLTGGNYTATVAGDALKIKGELDIVKNRVGWQTLPLDFEGVAIATAKLNGLPAVLSLDDRGHPQLLVREPGKQRLSVELTAPLTPGVDSRLTQFRLPQAPGDLVLTTAGENEIRLDGSETPLKSSSEKEVRIPLFDKEHVALTIAPKAALGDRKPILVAHTDSAVVLSPSQADWRETLDLDVTAKPIDVVTVALPSALQVIEVEAPDLAKWDVAADGDKSRLTVRFARAWSGKRAIKLHAIGATPLDKQWDLPHAIVANAALQTGQVQLSYDENLALEVRGLRSARRLSATTEAAAVERFAGWKSDYAVSVLTRAKQRKLSATIATLINVGRTKLELNSSVTVEPRNGVLFDVSLLLPKEWDVSAVELANKPLAFQRTMVGDKTRLDILLPEPVAANKQTTLLVKADRSPDGWLKDAGKPALVNLATVAVEGVAEVEGMVLIRAPAEIRVATANTKGYESVPVAGIPNADQFVRLALRHRTDAVSGKLESLLRPPLVSAEIDIAAVVTETHLATDYFVGYRVKQGVTDQLSFELPKTIATNEVEVRVLNGARLESQSVADVDAFRKRWTLKFDRDLDSSVRLQVHIDVLRAAGAADVKTGDPKRSAAASRLNDALVALPLLTVDQSVRQTGTIAIEGAFDQQVGVVAKDLRTIDPAELPTLPSRATQGRLVSAFQFRKPPYELSVRASKHPELPVLTAVCSQANIVSVLDESGTLRQQADLRIDNVGLQNLAIALPEGSEMLSVTLSGRPVELRRDGDKFLIAMPLAQTETASATVTVHYLTKVDALRIGGEFHQKPPTLNVPVVRIDWTLYLPKDQAVVESKGSVSPKFPLERDSLIGTIRKALLRRGSGRIFNPFEFLLPSEAAPFVYSLDGNPPAAYRRATSAVAKSDPASAPAGAPTEKSAALPSPYHMRDDVQSFPKGPRAPLENEMIPKVEPPSPRQADGDSSASELRKRPNGEVERSVTAKIQTSGAAAGFLRPGSFVDVSVFIPASGERPAISRTFLRNVRVVAVNAAQQPNSPQNQELCTFALNSEEAAKLAIAESTGTLKLTLRSSEDKEVEAGSVLTIDNVMKGKQGEAAGEKDMNRVGDDTRKQLRDLFGEGSKKNVDGLVDQIDQLDKDDAAGFTPIKLKMNKARFARGLLSLQMSLDTVGKPTEFLGTTGDGELLIRLVNDRFTGALTAAVAAAVMLLGWMARNWSRPARAFGIGMALALSLGLSGLAPLGWLFVLDGLFLGALGIWMLYMLRTIVYAIRNRPFASVLLAIALLNSTNVATAQSPPTNPEPQTTPALEAPVKPAANDDAAANLSVSADKLPTIYVPYDSKLDPLKSNQVYLPRNEYQQLWNRANPSKVILPDPATTGTISEVEYSGSLSGTTVRFEATMTAWSFRDDWVALKLPVASAIVGTVTIDGQPAALAGDRQPTPQTNSAKPRPVDYPTIFVRGRGAHQIAVHFELQAQRAGATGSLRLTLAPVGSARLKFELPEAGLEVEPQGVKNGWNLTGSTFFAAVSVGGAIDLRWQPTTNRNGVGEGIIVNLNQRSRVEVGQTGLRLTAELDYSLRQGSTRRLELAIPESLLVRTVTGDALADWFLQGTGVDRRLVLRTNRAVTGTQSFKVDALTPFPPVGKTADLSTTYPIPQLTALNVNRETGDVLIAADPALEVGVAKATGYQRTGKDSVAAPAGSETTQAWPVLAAYRFANRPASLALQVAGRAAKLTSDVRYTYTVEKERIRLTAIASLSQTGMPLVAARLRLPKDFNLDQVITDVKWTLVEDPAGAILEVEQTGLPDLVAEDATPILVTVQGWLNRDPAKPDAQLPAVEVIGSTKQRGEWAVYLAPGFDAETTGLTGLRPTEPSSLSATIASNVAIPRRRRLPRLAFRQESFPASLQLGLRKLSPRINVDVTTAVGVRETAVVIAGRMRFTIEQAGVRTLKFLAPDWLGQDVEVVGFGVRQVESFADANGKRRFEVGLDREFVGQYELRLTKVFPLPEDGIVRAPRLEPIGVESVRSFVLLENQSSDQLDRIETTGGGIESIEPDALPLAVAQVLRKRAVETLRLSPTAGEPRWKLRTSKPIEGLAASVNLFELTMVVSNDGQYRAQANLRVNNRLEQFLPLEFPEGSQIWSVFVAGQPSKPAKGTRGEKPVVLLPLPKTASGDLASNIEIVYTGKIIREEGTLKRWHFPSPRVVGDLPVAKTQWTLYLPKEFDYGFFEGMEEVETGVVELNRQEAELNDIGNVLTDFKKGKGSAKQRAYSNLSTWSMTSRNDNAVQSDKGRELFNKVQDQNRRVAQELQTIKQQGANPADNEQTRWVEFFDEFQSQPVDEETEASAGEAKAYEEIANQRGLLRNDKSRAIQGITNFGNEATKSRVVRNSPPAIQQQQAGQSRARLKGQLESQTAVLNRLQNEGQLGANSSAFGYKQGQQQQQVDLDSLDDNFRAGGKSTRAMNAPKSDAKPGADRGEQRAGGRPGGTGGGPGGPTGGGFVGGMYVSPPEQAPKRVGGLSLKIQLPTEGKPLNFVKARGEPALTVVAYQAELGQKGAAIGWLIATCLLTGGLAYGFSQPASLAFLGRNWRWLATAVGLIWWLALPASFVGFLVFLFGVVCIIYRRLWLRFAVASK